MKSEPEEGGALTAVPEATVGASEMTGAADGTAGATADVTADVTVDVAADATAGGTETITAGSAGKAAETAMPASAQPATSTAEALDTTPPPVPQDGVRIVDSLETIKTAVVWLIVIQILTILSPLLRVSLKWSLIVGLILTLSSLAVGALAYLKAQSAQRNLPE